MVKIISIIFLLLLVTCVASSYYCIYPQDNPAVKDFKYKIDTIAINNDLASGTTEEAMKIKFKYFGPCR